jgi:hypothetical protein
MQRITNSVALLAAHKTLFMLSSGTSIADPEALISSLQVANFCHNVLEK